MNPAVHAPPPSAAVIRAFVAVQPGAAAAEAVRRLQRELARRAPPGVVRWTHPGQFHVTLRFLGAVALTQVEFLTRRLAGALSGVGECELALGEVGAFPAPDRPRVLWVGLVGDMAGLRRLAQAVTAACEGVGDHPADADDFHPHLTLGRAGRGGPQALAGVLRGAPVLPPLAWRVAEVGLYQSRLTPQGAVHSVLARFPVGSPPA